MAFIVNKGGTVHSVKDDDLPEQLQNEGFRVATNDEIINWYQAQDLEVPAEFGGSPPAEVDPAAGGKAGDPGNPPETTAPPAKPGK